MGFNVLILGGTSEGRALSERLARDDRFASVVSYAGRTRSLQLPSTPHRVGGFGGVDGLASYLRRERVDALVDTTHPFAARMSAHAVEAAAVTGTPLLRLARPVWQPLPGDQFIEVADMHAAAAALGTRPKQVFLSVGRQEIGAFAAAPQHDYLVRAVDAFDTGLPRARVLAERGPFDFKRERALLVRECIELMVSKNSGTEATYPKIAAARELGLPVIMVQPPKLAPAPEAGSLDEVLHWLDAQAAE
ncbi:MAG: cobalt-precorrin-6A reductase [Polyangiales bacterium]